MTADDLGLWPVFQKTKANKIKTDLISQGRFSKIGKSCFLGPPGDSPETSLAFGFQRLKGVPHA